MPIRVECSRCHKVTYFADNDAGLAVACLECKTVLKVPTPAAAPKAVTPSVHPDEPPPLFASTPKHLMVAPPPVKSVAAEISHHRNTAKPRPVRPASPRSRWRLYAILLGVGLVGGLAIANKYYQDSHGGSLADRGHDEKSTTGPASKPTEIAPIAIKTNEPATKPLAIAPPIEPAPPIVARVVTPTLQARHYTPAGVPVGLIGFDRIQLGGRTLIDSYNSGLGAYSKETALANASVISNGPILLTVEGQIRAAVHAGIRFPIKPGKNLTIAGPTDSLPQPLNNPPIELDPLSNDSANSNLPEKFFKQGNFNLDGKNTLSLPAGVYYVQDFVITSSATLHLNGPVTFLVSGQAILSGKIETHENRPANCRIRATSDKPVVITHSNTLYLDIYAPQSPIHIDGKGDLFGSIVGKSLVVNGSRNFHFDEALQK